MKDINIGDPISLEIKNISKEVLEESFNSLHIDTAQDNYIKFRSFEVGDNKILVNNYPLNIKVSSALKEEDIDIFMNLSDESNLVVNTSSLPLTFIFFTSITLVSLGILVKEILKIKRKNKVINPEERFLTKINSLREDSFYFEISLALREYIDSKYTLNFLQGIYQSSRLIKEDDIEFLTSLDYYKFSQDKNIDMTSSRKKALSIFKRLKEEINVQI